MYICIYVYMYMCIYVYMYICVFIYIYIFGGRLLFVGCTAARSASAWWAAEHRGLLWKQHGFFDPGIPIEIPTYKSFRDMLSPTISTFSNLGFALDSLENWPLKYLNAGDSLVARSGTALGGAWPPAVSVGQTIPQGWEKSNTIGDLREWHFLD